MSYEGKGSVANSSQIWDGSKWVERSSGIVAPHDTTHSPVALYQLNESLDDTSGNALTGLTVVGTERYTEILPGIRGIVCSGNYAYVNATEASLQITGDLTLEVVVVLYSLPSTSNTMVEIAAVGETEATNVLYKIAVDPGGVLAYFAEQGAGVNIQYLLNRMMSVGVPVHVALVRSSNNVTFYLNGEQVGATSTGLSAPTGGTSGKLYIGTNADATLDFDGAIASVKIIGSALTPAQIREEYNRTLGPALGKQNLFSYKSAIFNGTDEYVTMGDVLDFEYTDDLSISCWIKTTATSGIIISKMDTTNYRGYSLLLQSTGRPELYLRNDNSPANQIRRQGTTSGYNDGRWHHLVATWKGNASPSASDIRIYVDGNDESGNINADNLSATLQNAAPFTLAARNAGADSEWAGTLSNPAIYDKELSAKEVEWIYNNGRPQDLRGPGAPSGLVGWWTLGEDVSSTTAPDRSVNSNNGTLTNMTEAANITTDHPI